MKIRLAVACALLCALAFSATDTTLYPKPNDKAFSRQVPRQTIPQALPTSPTTMIVGDFYCEGLTIKNTNSTAVTVTIQSVTGGVVLLDSNTSIPAGQLYAVVLPGYWFVGGVVASASTAGVNVYFTGRN